MVHVPAEKRKEISLIYSDLKFYRVFLCCSLIINPVFLEDVYYFCFIKSQAVFEQNLNKRIFNFGVSAGPHLMAFNSENSNIWSKFYQPFMCC